jgi:hypothetical protein
MDDAKSNNWKNITQYTLNLTLPYVNVTELNNPGLRSQVNPVTIFYRLFSKQIISLIREHTQTSAKMNGNDDVSFSEDDIVQFIALLISACALRIRNFKDYVRDQARVGISCYKYKQMRKYLMFQTSELFQLFNENLHSLIKISMLCKSNF